MEYSRKVFGYECDIYGHVNNANYLHILEEARAEALSQMETPIRWLNEQGVAIYVTRVELDYLRGIPLDSTVTVKTSWLKASRLRSVWKQEMYIEDGTLCAVAVVHGAFIKAGKPTRISPELYAHYQKYIKLSD
ncbi:MAG: acyl-CoA thioesterase [Candidatus Cloacimonetes bacterium]|nr:acyl-CoA thioesterase [Candidatus Cloacimonadota bacterium]